ncbi:hypothetical protein BKA69DRAFT_59262 [Paraphysoderma sedebokerense]|nr:hypothetical protein BKA69DRAFT_59262 [Paraphysoderma sedebokerense]
MDENKIDNSIIVPRDELEGLVEEECENGDGLLPSCSYQFPFSLTQLDEIRFQMEQNFQIVAQNYSLSKDVYGGESHSTRHWQSQLQEIVGQKDAALQEGFVASFFNLPGLTVVDWITEYEVEGNTRVEFFANRFNDHMKGSGSKERVKVDKKRKAKDFLKLTIRSQDILRGLGSILDSELLPQIVKEKRNERFFFTDDLDNLLNIGLRYLGSSYDTIHSICVPAVSATQLSRRFGSLSLRKASANVIKDFSLLQVKPLTVFESHTLAEAVQLFGRNFDYIARCILVERTSKFLELAYNQMERFGFSVHGAPPPTAQSVSLPILNTNATNIVDMLPPPHQVEELLSLDLNSADISLLDSFPLVDPSEAISDAPVKAHDGIIVDVGAGWNIPDLEALMNMDVFDNTLLDTSLQVPLTVPPSIDDIDWTAFLKDAELAASELPQPSQPVSKSQAPTPLILSPRKQNVITRVPEISFGGDKLSRNNNLKPKSSSKPNNKENVGKTSSFSHRRSSITKRKRDSIPSSNGTKKRRLFRPPTLHRTSSSVL